MKVVRVLLLLLILFSCLSTTFPIAAATSSGYVTDRLSLIDIKNQVTDDPSGVLRSWNDSSNDICNWTGVSCSSYRQRVTAIDLSSRGLSGFISPSIANLTFLTNFTIANNGFYGQIPLEIGNLRHLQILDLSYNSFHGAILTNLTYCSNLTTLDLDSNSLSGTIPTDLGFLSSLGFLSLQNNNLTGEIPASIGNLSFLYHLDLRWNQLQGMIPEELGGLLQLQYFQVSANELSGTVPRSIYNLSLLYCFGVAANQLEGRLPPTMGITLPNLEKVVVGGNQFEGRIPISLPNASRISFVEMSINSLSGNIPPDLGRLASLHYLNLETNALESSGPDGWAFLASLANCTQLKMLSFDHNNLTGDLPESVTNLSTSLRELRLNRNQISGTIPSGIGNLINLTILALGPNLVTGSIPESIGMLTKLQLLTLYQSRLVGSIPPSLGNLTRLSYLYLTGNGFEGHVPSSLGNLDMLEELGLGNNGFTGAIPGEIFGLPSLTACGLAYNSFVGSLPSEVGKARYLNRLYIAGNKLSGEIPSTLGSSQMLEVVDLKQNFFQGSIPSSLGNLKGLQWLDLSRNNLSGPIPEFLGSLSLLYLNLSFNDFEGEVPVKGIFRNATATSLEGNDGLCGGNVTFRLPPCLGKSPEKKRRVTLLFKLVIAVASVVFLLAVLFFIALVIRKMKSRSGTAAPVALVEDRYPRASYSDLARATGGFSHANLIGTGSYGSVYRGRLDRGGAEVAVKVFNLQHEGASKSFINECEALRSIRHRNLVKVLTSCSSVDPNGSEFKALVFELLPNGNLESWLHPEEEDGGYQTKRLNMIQRLNIAVDVADALEYLHCDCQVPVIHCDLKPSNIILDYDMVARVGDFGLASLVHEALSEHLQGSRSRSSIGIKGTIGYVAPEYGVGGQVSTSGDVYSYGILLLEMFTGRRPVNDQFKDGLSLREFVQVSCPGQATEIIDPVLLLDTKEGGHNHNKTSAIREYAASVLRVGLSCSKASSRERPNIRDVATELHAIRDALLLAAGVSEW